MSVWIDNFKQHSVHNKLVEVTERTKSLLEESEDERLDRISQILALLHFHLQNCDPELVGFSNLESISQYLNTIGDYYTNFVQSQNGVYLDNAVANADHIIPQISFLNVPKSATDIEGFKEAIISFRRSLGQNRRTLNEEFEAFNSQLQSLGHAKNEINTALEELGATLETEKNEFVSHSEQVANEIASRLEEYKDQLSSLLGNFENTYQAILNQLETKEGEWEDRFNDKQGVFANRFTEQMQIFTQAFMHQEATLKASVDVIEEEIKGNGNAVIDELQAMKEKAIALVNAIGYTGTASGYQEIAKDAKKAKRMWRGVAFFSMLGAAIYSAIYAFKFDPTTTWPALVSTPI